MKPLTAITALALVGLTGIRAQNVPPETPEDPVQRAIREFNQRDKSKTNEVTVTLDPPQETPPQSGVAQAGDGKPDDQKDSAENKPAPMLVTGNPPEDTDVIDSTTKSAPPATGEEAVEAPKAPPQQGLAVRVEKLQTGSGNIDAAKVKLLAPFPAKPLAQAPAGWRLESSENAPPFTRDVELAPGKKITLTIRPHLLVPEADGATVFAVAEPGFDSSLGYRQHATVGAVLSRSIRQLDDDSRDLGSAIDNLQQLLVSLPKPETPQIPAEAPKPARKR